MKNKCLTLLCLLALQCFMLHAKSSIQIDTPKRNQTLEGWGVSICWWGNMAGHWTDEHLDSLVEWLVSPEGLNYNVFRYNIGGGDDPQWRNCTPHHMARPRKGKGYRAEMPGFKLYPDSEYDWTADSAQIKVLLKIREARPDAIFEAFSNSAPWWMTVSGCCAGHEDPNKDNLAPEYYEAFCQYLIDVCLHFRDAYGIEFRTLEPFNEPYTNYWYRSGSQEGCHFDPESQVDLLHVLYPMLQASGLNNTTISASDETATKASLRDLQVYGDAIGMLSQWNVHTYGATNGEREAIRNIVKEKGLRLWMSESGDGGRGIEGNLKMLQRLFDDMRYLQPVAWVDWQYADEHTDQWALVGTWWKPQQSWRLKNYYVRQQVTRFIRQGYVFLDVDDDQTLCAISPDEKEVVLVRLNNEHNTTTFTYDLSSLGKIVSKIQTYTTSATQSLEPSDLICHDNALEITLQPQSVITCILTIE
ncbi:MAG: glycoside hydrolase [Bacteroidaceae bacterium]|nr:glycoside hydrolase [Bacteroidaceae bacterium]